MEYKIKVFDKNKFIDSIWVNKNTEEVLEFWIDFKPKYLDVFEISRSFGEGWDEGIVALNGEKTLYAKEADVFAKTEVFFGVKQCAKPNLTVNDYSATVTFVKIDPGSGKKIYP